MADVTTIRFSSAGEKFEILVKPDPALEYRLGKRSDISSVMVSDEVYTDSGKGTRASSEKIRRVFGTDNATEVVEKILKKGELSLTTDQRRKMTEEKRRQIVSHIAANFVDPRSHLPHPPLRIEQAMKDARVSVDPHKNADDQINDIIDKIRRIIPLRTERMDLVIVVPAQYAARSYSVLHSVGKIKREDWLPNGSLKAILEISAAARSTVIDRLGSITRGTATIEVAG